MRLQVQYQAQLADIHDEHIRALVSLALLCGWKRSGTPKGILLVAPDHKTIKIPENESLNAKTYQAHLKSILTHRDSKDATPTACLVDQVIEEFKLNPSYVFFLRKAGGLPRQPVRGKVKKEPLPELPEIVVTALPQPGDEEMIEPWTEPEPVVEKAVAKKAAAQPRETVKVHGKLIGTKPWRAHSGGGKETYKSHAVLERDWEDGYVDYVCSRDGCNWSDENPKSVSAHHSSHTRKEGTGRVIQAPRDGVDPDHEVNHRAEARIKALAREITTAMAAVGVHAHSPQALAEHIITHRVEREDTAAEISAIPEGEDLDDATILDKIAALLDHGRGVSLKTQVEELNEKVDKLTEIIEAERKRADAAEDDFQALEAMLKERNTRKTQEEEK